MKKLAFFLLLMLSSLHSRAQEVPDSTSMRADTAVEEERPLIPYSEQELSGFLDSVGHADLSPVREAIAFTEDSIFRSFDKLGITLSAAEFEELKYGLFKEDADLLGQRISLVLANKIFTFPIDTQWVEDSMVRLDLISFDRRPKQLDEFAVSIGYSGLSWGNDLYFFKANKIIAHIYAFHRYGLEINSFRAKDGNTVIYYKENFGSGTGVWQFNYYFYKYTKEGLKPVLNILQNGNLNGWGTPREFWLEAFIKKKHTLKMKFEYHFKLRDTIGYSQILKRTAKVHFDWDKATGELKGRFHDRFRQDELYCYDLDTYEIYFIHVYYPLLSGVLDGREKGSRTAVLRYLNEVRNDMNAPSEP